MNTSDAMELAATVGLQLVEVNPKANPPVCKILDYGKYKYETAKRDREARKNQKTQELKEVKFRPKTHGHDFDFKLNHVRRFLGDGDKVKLVVQFRGREVIHPETGRAILDRVVAGVVDLATVIQMASMEGNRMNMVLAPKVRPQAPRPKAASSTRPPRPAAAAGDAPAGEGDDADDDDLDDDDLDDDVDDDGDDDDTADADDDAVPPTAADGAVEAPAEPVEA
jgi:translation initiation factor IF-3